MGKKRGKKGKSKGGGGGKAGLDKCVRCGYKSVATECIPNRKAKAINQEGDKRVHTCTTHGCSWWSEATYHKGEWVWRSASWEKDRKKKMTRYQSGRKIGR